LSLSTKKEEYVLAADYPFLDVLWTLLIFFAWVIWFWLLITVFADLFRRHDISGWGKAGWVIFVIVLPFLGVLVYLIAESKGMAERNTKDVQQAQEQTDEYIRSVAASSDPAEQIARAKQLLDSGAISNAEYDALKQKALAT
jgi:Short C-terminal domain/Phospholipase_D-nuclease N-terminal